METKEIEALIRFHEAGLSQYRQYISPSAQYLEEQTIKALGELKDLSEEIPSSAVKAASEVLNTRKGDKQ